MWSSHCFGLFYQWTSWPKCVSFFGSWACLWHLYPFFPLSLHCHGFELFTFPFFHSYGLLEHSTGRAVQIRLCCQNRASRCSCSFACFWWAWLKRSHSEIMRGPAEQLVLIAFREQFFFSFWGLPSQPGCSDVRRAGHQPSGNVQAATHRGNRRTAQIRTAPYHSINIHTYKCSGWHNLSHKM